MDCFFQYTFSTGLQTQQHTGTGPCTSQTGNTVVQCCDVGDICRADGFCQSDGISSGASGFYMAGCTDPNFADPACPTACTSFSNSDIIYDYTIGDWRCCGTNSTGERDCGRPIGSPFQAPGPVALGYVATIVATSSGLPLATSIPVLTGSATAATDLPLQVTSSASTSTQKPITTGSPSLSSSEIGGIAVGAFLGGMLVLALVGLAVLRFRRYSKYRRAGTGSPPSGGNVFPHPLPQAIHPPDFYAPQDAKVEHMKTELATNPPAPLRDAELP